MHTGYCTEQICVIIFFSTSLLHHEQASALLKSALFSYLLHQSSKVLPCPSERGFLPSEGMTGMMTFWVNEMREFIPKS